MTPDELIELAKKHGAHIHHAYDMGELVYSNLEFLPHDFVSFCADLEARVREDEREKCAKVCDAKYRVLEARRAYADSTTLGGANHVYFCEAMKRVHECATAIRAMKE
ncbi:MAG: hypothetical protein KGI11_08520 [Thaumarchaeota archaeon]|nr:hypothetical protein [Nitrososphaerota archaeon]